MSVSAPAPASPAERRRQLFLGLGLLLLFLGLFLTLGSIPDDSGNLVPYVLTVGGALLCVLAGGILLGRASGVRATSPGPR